MNYPNPYQVTIPSDSEYGFNANSYAAYYQRVNIIIGGQVVAEFNGQGEDVPMTVNGGGTVYEGATRQALIADLEFLYSPDGSSYLPSTVAFVSTVDSTVTIGTEDSNDSDNNDTRLILNTYPL